MLGSFHVNWTQARVIWEEGIKTKKPHPKDWPIDRSAKRCLDRRVRAQLLVVLGHLKKQTEQAMGNKPVAFCYGL